MISERAKKSFDEMLILGLRAGLNGAGEDVNIESIVDAKCINESQAVVLTLSSFVFRAMAVIYFTPNPETKAFFAAVNKQDPQDTDENSFLDAVRECGNICCGTISRELVRVCPHVGMSTPNIIDRECVLYLDSRKSGYLRHFSASCAGGMRFFASLSVSDFGDVDFDWSPEVVENAGELEFF